MVGKTANSTNLHSSLIKSSEARNKTLNKIASGKKINTASDDPAGLAVANAMEAQKRGLMRQISNRQDEISLIQTAEGALGSTNDMLQRINELSVQASNGTLTDSDREMIQLEIDQLSEQINMTANNTEFNTKKLLDGSLNVQLQNGNDLNIQAMNAQGLGVANIDVTTQAGASNAIGSIRQAIDSITSERGSLGAIQNGISHEIEGLQKEMVNTMAAQSRIQDADLAMEIINMSRQQLSTEVAIKSFKMQDEARTTVLNLLAD
jgi:flagellin